MEHLYEEKTVFHDDDKHVKRLHSEEIRSYMNKSISIFFFMALLSYIPGLLILFSRDEVVQTELFYKIWWLIIVALVVHYTVSILAYLKPLHFYEKWPLT